MHYGTIAVQFAGQEFLSSGRDKLYYWTREAKSISAEVDFVSTAPYGELHEQRLVFLPLYYAFQLVGIVNKKVLPAPVVDSTHILPPCISTTFLQ